MKTTVEVADDLLLLAKQRALDQGTTLKALIDAGLRHALSQAPESSLNEQPYRFPVIRDALKASAGSDADINGLIDAMRDEHLGQFFADGRAP